MRMSRTGFSIRKLINQRRSWPESDDENEEAFECSSAKTIRMQHELEQYQLQQVQKEGRHQLRHRSSWMNGSSSPKNKGQRRIPEPITVVRHTSDGVMVQSGNASRRISTPLPLSSRFLAGRISPATPHSRSSDDPLCPFCGSDLNQQQQQQHQHQHHQCQHATVHRRSASCLSPARQSPRRSRPLASDLLSPGIAPTSSLTKKLSYEKSYVNDAAMRSPSPGLRDGGHRAPSPRQPTPTAIHDRNVHVRTPSFRNSTDITIDSTSRSSSAMSTHTQQQPAFIHGQPSPPLEPEDESRGSLRVIPPQSKLWIDGESTWFLGEERTAVPNNVQQMIWETDEAFKAVSSALADARQASPPQTSSEEVQAHLQNSQQAPRDLQTLLAAANHGPTPGAPSQLMSPMSPTAGAGRGTVAMPRKSNKSSPLSPSPQFRRSPTRRTSISKSKRGSKSPSPKASRPALYDSFPSKSITTGSPSKGHRQHHSYHRSLTRLNLAADKVTDRLFEGRGGRFGFIKIEADEVVTPSQVQLFRQTRLAKAEAEAQAEAKRTASSETLRSVAGSFGDGNYSDVATTENTTEPFDANANVLRPAVEVSSPESLSELSKDVVRQTPIITVPKTPTETKDFKIGQNLLVTPPATPPQLSAAFPSHASNAVEDDSMHSRNIGFPKLSSRRSTHTRANSSTSHIPLLPTIPEVRITAPQARDISKDSQQQGRHISGQHGDHPAIADEGHASPYFEEDDEHMFFVSTPLTGTVPAFQHGRIRLAKADLVNAGTINSLESKLLTSPDETLDWTAFQMAILGGAGELFSDPDSFLSRDAQEDMVDDLCDWFEDLGFSSQNLGSLQTKEEDPSSGTTPAAPLLHVQAAMTSTPGSANKVFHDPSRTRHPVGGSRSSSPESRSSDELSDEEVQEMAQVQSMPIPISSEHPSGFWNTRPFDASRFFTGSGCSIKRWTLEGHPKRYQGPGIDVGMANTLPRSNSDLGGSPKPRRKSRRESLVRASIDSLPQSPMLDLRMTTAVDGSKELVPMGYNLGHDLGDFLKWESEHVSASGFYGSD